MDKYLFKTENFKLIMGKRYRNTDNLLEEVDRKMSFSGNTAGELVMDYLHERINVMISWEFILLFLTTLSVVFISFSPIFKLIAPIFIIISAIFRIKVFKEIRLISFNYGTIMSMANLYNKKTDEE